MPILLNKISTKGGRGGQKSPKSCLRRIRTAPNVPGYFNVEIRALFFLNLIMEIIKSTKNTTPVIMAMAANTSRMAEFE